MWEWLFICQARRAGQAAAGADGCGVRLGVEPLLALLRDQGCRILATDLHADLAQAAGWTDTGHEYSGGLERLNESGPCPRGRFEELVTYRHVDCEPSRLPSVPSTFPGRPVPEHLGSLEAGAGFVLGQMGLVLRAEWASTPPSRRLVRDDTSTPEARSSIAGENSRYCRIASRLLGDFHLDQVKVMPPRISTSTCHRLTGTHLKTKLGEFVTTLVA